MYVYIKKDDTHFRAPPFYVEKFIGTAFAYIPYSQADLYALFHQLADML